MRFLDNEGYRKNDEDDYFVFKFEGHTYVVFKLDSLYLQVLYLLNADGYSKSQMLEACNELNNRKVILKFMVKTLLFGAVMNSNLQMRRQMMSMLQS